MEFSRDCEKKINSFDFNRQERVLLVGLCSENELHIRASKHTVRNTEGLGNISKGMKLYHGIGITRSTWAWKPEWYRHPNSNKTSQNV